MENSQIKRRSHCPISFSLDVFGDKWSLLILRDIMFYNRTHFRDFAPHEHISTNILSDRLAKLEAMDLISKQRDPKLKNQYIYSVTPTGKTLLPLLTEMTLWGLEHDPGSLASEAFVSRAQTEKQKVVREIARSIERNNFVDYRSREMGISF
jgi:DNA-binding HxlR family transcriptional regulator